MEINDEQMVQAPLQEVWAALNDPLVLRECIPGCDQMDRVSDSEFRLGMLAVVGPIKARFTGKLLLLNVDAPNSYTLNFEGAGGAAGFGKGSASVGLSSEGPALTKLKYSATAQVGGKLAQVGSRLIDGIARKIAADFFIKFGTLLAAEAPALQTAPENAPGAAASSPDENLQTKAVLSKTVPGDRLKMQPNMLRKWAIALAAVVVCAGLAAFKFGLIH